MRIDLMKVIREYPSRDISWCRAGILDIGKRIASIVQDNQEEYFFVVCNSDIDAVTERDDLLNNYHVAGIFEIGNCYFDYPYCRDRTLYSIWHISKKQSNYIKIGIFWESVHPYRDDYYPDRFMPDEDEYNTSFSEYISKINKWIIDGQQPIAEIEYCYNTINADEFDYKRLFL